MTIRLRTAFFILIGILTVWLLYIERAILTPFILAAIFAYIFNPLINFFGNKVKLHRGLSVIIIYVVLIGIVAYLGTLLTTRVLHEYTYFRDNLQSFKDVTRDQINTLPDFAKPYFYEIADAIQKTNFTLSISIIKIFPQAFLGIVNFFVFAVSGYYFLKEGGKMFDNISNFAPKEYRIELDILFRRINAVLSEYLRGQLFLIFIMSVFLFIPLEILHVKFALVISIFSGVAELIPLVGPIIASLVAAAVVFLSGSTAYGMTTIQVVFIVLLIYFVTRQIQDYLIVPHIMGRIVKLHPIIILFAVIAGEDIAGVLGAVLSVPIAAVIKILLEFSMDKINERGS